MPTLTKATLSQKLVRDARREAKGKGYITRIPLGTVETWFDRDGGRNWVTQLKDSDGNQIGDSLFGGNREDGESNHVEMFDLAAGRFACVGPFFPPDTARLLLPVLSDRFGTKLRLTVPEREGRKKGQCQFIVNKLELGEDELPGDNRMRNLSEFIIGAYAMMEVYRSLPH